MNNLNSKLVTPINDKEFLKYFNKIKISQRYLDAYHKTGILFKEGRKMASWDECNKINKIKSLIKDKEKLEKALRHLDRTYNDSSEPISFIVGRLFPFIGVDSNKNYYNGKTYIDINFDDFSLEIRKALIKSFRETLVIEKNRIEDEILKLMNGESNGR